MKNSGDKRSAKYITLFIEFLQRLRTRIRKLDSNMEGKYSPSLLALSVTVIAALVMSIILFFPNYLGVANDGSADGIMKTAGIYYMEKDPDNIYANYFIRTYTEVASGMEIKGKVLNSQLLFLKAAKILDHLFTKDNLFDIRFLSFLYFLLYLPASI